MKVALVSLNQVWEDKNSNRLKVSNCLQTDNFPEYRSRDFSGDDFDRIYHACGGTCRMSGNF